MSKISPNPRTIEYTAIEQLKNLDDMKLRGLIKHNVREQLDPSYEPP